MRQGGGYGHETDERTLDGSGATPRQGTGGSDINRSGSGSGGLGEKDMDTGQEQR